MRRIVEAEAFLADVTSSSCDNFNVMRMDEQPDSSHQARVAHVGPAISDKLRREVLERDGSRCVLCGLAAGKPYPDQPTLHARLLVRRFVADSPRGPADPLNLRTECSRCNEPVTEQARRSESADELSPRIRNLRRIDKARLFTWIEKGYRERDAVDVLFDQIRVLPAVQRDQIRALLRRALRGEK